MKNFLYVILIVLCLAGVSYSVESLAASPHGTLQPPALPQVNAQGILTCASNDGRRNVCLADTRAGVQLVNQRSSSPCVFGQTWGYDARGVWVDRGCRADFQVKGTWGGWDQGYNVYCASDDGGRQRCPTDTRGGVQMVRQRSSSPCIYMQTWGWDKHGIWVDRGCRADFQIGSTGGGWRPGGPGWQPSKNVITCSSNNGSRVSCPANTSGGVRLIRQRSDSDCIYNRTWGYDRRSVWVDRGCRADFEVGGY
jgi:hypothetical protein